MAVYICTVEAKQSTTSIMKRVNMRLLNADGDVIAFDNDIQNKLNDLSIDIDEFISYQRKVWEILYGSCSSPVCCQVDYIYVK